MAFIWFLISILVIILILISVVSLKITFDSNEHLDFHIKITWLKSLFRTIIQNNDTDIFLTVYLFNKKILTKPVKAKSKESNKSKNHNNKVYYLKQVKPNYIYIDTSYGFQDPSTTGIICGVINSFAQLLNINDVCNEADFTAEKNYFNINGIIKLNIASTLIKLLKSYMKTRKFAYGK